MTEIFDTLASSKRLLVVGFDQQKAEEITDLIKGSISQPRRTLNYKPRNSIQ